MVTFSVTIDEESNQDLFLRIMEELKFVKSVSPVPNPDKMNPVDFVMPGSVVTDMQLEDLMLIAEKENTYDIKASKKISKRRIKQWHENEGR